MNAWKISGAWSRTHHYCCAEEACRVTVVHDELKPNGEGARTFSPSTKLFM